MIYIVLSPNEMGKLAHFWEFHSFDCHNNGDIKIELIPGSGIGTVVKATCGCGREMDITDYRSW